MLIVLLMVLIAILFSVRVQGMIGLKLLALILAVQIIVYAIYYVDISYTSIDLTYGSDARYYFDYAVASSVGLSDCSKALAPLFVCAISSVLGLSPNYSHYYVVFFTTLLLTLSILIIFKVEIEDRVYSGNNKVNLKQVVLLILLLNPLILWASIRGLKEPLIIFIASISYLNFQYYIASRKSFLQRVNFTVVQCVLIFILEGLKPLGGLLVALTLLAVWLSKYVGVKKFTLLVLIGYLGVTLQVQSLIRAHPLLYRVLAHRESVESDLVFVPGFKDFILAPFRFIFGPGPIRSFRQLIFGDVFKVSTFIGDMLIFIGSSIWWIALILGLKSMWGSLTRRKLLLPYRHRFLFFFTLFYILTYSLIYLGSGDTRHRAIMYFFSAPILIKILYKNVNRF